VRARLALIITALLGSACSSLSAGAGGTGEDAASEQRDARFMREISQANVAEIAAGKLAAAQGRSVAVKQFGRWMVEEHTTLEAEGAALVQAKALQSSPRPDPRHPAAMQELEALSGEEFDRAYLEQMRRDHAAMLELLKQAAAQASDPQLRTLAQRAAPRVQQHLAEAQRLAGSVVGIAR
jgi:putative membrane protein